MLWEELVFITDFAGKLHCLDADTGKPHWVYDGKKNIWGSCLVADGKVLLTNVVGDLHILKASKQMKHLKTIKFGVPIYTSPVVANGTLYIGTNTHLYAFGKKKD